MSGWVCSYRAVWDHPLFAGDAERVGVWDWMVKKAAWKPTRFKVNGKVVTLQRGQLCVSHRQICEETGMSHQRLRTLLAELQANKAITQDTTLGRTVITICNYSRYQDKDGGENTHSNTAATQQQHTKEQENNITSSVSKETGVIDAVSEPVPFDMWKVVFDLVLPALKRAGHDERAARSIIGKWRKEGHCDVAILKAYEGAQKAGAAEPFTYMQAILSKTDAPDAMDEVAAILAKRRSQK